MKHFLGIDIGTETVKLAELCLINGKFRIQRLQNVMHHKDPKSVIMDLFTGLDWRGLDGAAVCGCYSRLLDLPKVPAKQARIRGFRYCYDNGPATLVAIGSHGFSVLELHAGELQVYRENSRCSQGTGNFLRQLVERFDLDIEQASELCAPIDDPAPLSGRCPVILKTDMTHLANQGVSRARILAGLYDAVCENVRALVNPRTCPPRLLLTGGVSRSKRIRDNFSRYAAAHGIDMLPVDKRSADYLDAIGTALEAASDPRQPPAMGALLIDGEEQRFETVPALASYLGQVRRMPAMELTGKVHADHDLVIGFDIGSTGSKVIAVDTQTREPVWENYLPTSGDPVGAMQRLLRRFLDSPAASGRVVAIGATGSGREITGSLIASCVGAEHVFVLNEIAAHAEGACHFDQRVDTIFEIGGQDAKYIRLDQGRVVDAAMNEACSAGTGSFIEEQGRKFSGIDDATQLCREALSADGGLSLGQHCSVFMAEVIDDAVVAGIKRQNIIAGIYDSVIQNYLNRVMGTRSVGQVIFCQGMPFASDALAAAVVRQTGSEVVIPPNPGTVGALGIALLTQRALPVKELAPIDLQLPLLARIKKRDTFICGATKGCGTPGNKCRIDRIHTSAGGHDQRFTWGGACSLWERGTTSHKLPDLTPDPFREHQELVAKLLDDLEPQPARPTVAMTGEFLLKGLFPFFAVFLDRLGFNVITERSSDRKILKRGIEEAGIPFCAPMQLYYGVVSSLAEQATDYLFLPMVRSLPRVGAEPKACTCPIIQGSADILSSHLRDTYHGKIVSPVIDIGPGNFASTELSNSLQRLAVELGVTDDRWKEACRQARSAQTKFEQRLLAIGRQTLAFCDEHQLIPVVVLGRPYTIYHGLLNANLPALLREQGAVPIPIDCYPVADGVPVFHSMYWGQGQRNLRAACQIRETEGIYSLWASNYSCGPDSFNLHFYAHLMAGKPFTVIETDGHTGDAGTKTRVEAFLQCVREDLASERPRTQAPDPARLASDEVNLNNIRQRSETVLIPRLGSGAEVLATCLRGVGIDAESLPMPDRESLRLGRRHTSGKECVPMTVTLGSLLQRLENEDEPERRFTFLMPTTDGPCRFGIYHLLHRLVLDRLGYGHRVRMWSPNGNENYFDEVPSGFSALILAGFAAHDVLLEALHDSRPVEDRPGAANRIHRHYQRLILRRIEKACKTQLSLPTALYQAAYGSLFGLTHILASASRSFARIRTGKVLPKVLVTGEIYVRCDPFSNGFLIDQLEARGLRVRLAPFSEWLEYVDQINRLTRKPGFDDQLYAFVRQRIQERSYNLMRANLGWPARARVTEMVEAAKGLVRQELGCEAILSVGGALHEWRQGHIDAVVNVGPLECLPCKIAEAQLHQAAKDEQLLSLSLPINGEPISPDVLDTFAFEVHSRFRRRVADRIEPSHQASA